VTASEVNEAKQAAFEEELKLSHELDDPLEVWIRYLGWTKDAFPWGNNAHSGYIELLERCSKQFVRSTHYANDPRYLKIWIEYARFSDDPRELFCFLARNEIGQQLATFYEEFAAWLEGNGRKGQADEVYQMGLMAGARPTSRLRRLFDEFSARLAANPPAGDEARSPPIAQVRAALTTKFGGVPDAQQAQATLSKPNKPKLMIFDDAEAAAVQPVGTGGWGSIGTLRDRKKENTVETRTMQGEKLKQRGGLAPASQKLAVFVDPAAPVKKAERVACDLEAVYAIEGEELSFEELKAQSMGLLNHVWPLEQVSESPKVHEDVYVSVMDADSPIKDNARTNKSKMMASPTINTKAAMDDILDLFNKPLKYEQSDASSDSEEDEADDEPTNTFPGNAAGWAPENAEATTDSQYQSDESSDEDEPALPVLSESEDEHDPAAISSDELTASNLLDKQVENDMHLDLPAVPATPQPEVKHSTRLNMMTPITEDTENLLLSVVKPRPLAIAEEEADQASDHDDPLYSSPFIENPVPRPTLMDQPAPKRPALAQKLKAQATSEATSIHEVPTGPVKGPLVQEMLCNPMDISVRQQIFRCMYPQLDSFTGCKLHPNVAYGKKFEAIEKYIRALNKRGAGEATQHLEVILDFASRYAIKRKLGEGAFAPVFLVENISGLAAGSVRRKFEACKIERPSSAWEFYMMRQAERRLGVGRASQSVARAHEYYQFQDTSFLLIDFKDQGTILDLVNSARSDAGGVDEVLAMFLAVELLRVMEQMHAKGLIHGDLKADNCLLRFDAVAEQAWSAAYKRDGSCGWDSKGVSLIDFGRSIDMRVFKEGVQFMADWKTDEQDCVEMREARPWTYQVDYHGLAGILHSLLFGKYIETSVEATGLGKKRYTLKNSFKRYWKQDLWEPCFDMLLNPLRHAVAGELPINSKLREVRESMEAWLETNSEKGVGLRAMIRKIETDLSQSKKR
jgi:checkpoint serine/threonine-protein kinase